jgi:hypothetical protein
MVVSGKFKVMQSKLLIATVLLAFGLLSAKAITTVAGVNFQDNAFADTVISSSGNYTLAGVVSLSPLSAAVTSSSLTKYAFDNSPAAGDYIKLGFTDNYLINGAGNDLAIFTIGGPDDLSVTLNSVTKDYTTANTFFTTLIGGTTYKVYEAQIDLNDFNAVVGAQFSSVLIGMGIGPNLPALSVVGALNSAPVNQSVPDAGSTISMLGMAFLGLGLLKRKF